MSSFFSREELLGGGLPARRAGMLLFAIENRAAQLAARDVRDAAVYLSFAGAQTREQDFFAALAHGRADASVTIQQIERYAAQWKSLLPETPDAKLSAALAQLLGAKYQFTRAETPHLRAALRLDAAATQQAFQAGYNKPLDSIYAPRLDPAAHARFAWGRLAGRLEALPPFWLAFFLTMPGAAGLLALPVALAHVGLGGGLLLLVVFGLLNLITAAALAEATARSGITRFGLGWLGQLAQEYLGSAGSLFLTLILALNNFFVLIIFYLAVGGTLQDATHLPAAAWVLALFALGVYFLTRGSLNATIAVTLLIVFGSLLLLLLIPLLALPHFDLANIFAAPFISLDFASVQLGFGVLLSTYFSHPLVATYGTVVMRRDAGARSWIWGCAAAIFGFMLVAMIWLVVVNGAIPPDVLAQTTGTVLTPLAGKAGALVLWLGTLLVIVSLGLASIQIALGLFYMMQERLPAPRAGSLIAQPRVRFLVCVAPLVGVLVLAEWLVFTGAGTFAQFLGILGAFSLPLLAGVLPVLLFASTRRKGDFVPRRVVRWLGNRMLLFVVYLFFVGIIFVYGLVIFQDLPIRILMVGVGVTTLAVTVVILRRGAFTPRLVLQICDDQRAAPSADYSVVADGAPARVKVALEFNDHTQTSEAAAGELQSFPTLRTLSVTIGSNPARELKVWAYRLMPNGAAEGIPARVEVKNGTAAIPPIELRAQLESKPVAIQSEPVEIRLELPSSLS